MKMTTILEDLLQKGHVGVLLSTGFDETNGDLKTFTFLEGVTVEDRADLISQQKCDHPQENIRDLEQKVDDWLELFTTKAREFCEFETVKEQEEWWEDNSVYFRGRHLTYKYLELREVS